MNTFIRTVLLLFVLLQYACINQRPDVDCTTYDEATIPDGTIDPIWEKTGRGLHASFGSTNIRYEHNSVPMQLVTKKKHFSAWRGERISAQVVLWSVRDIKQVECEWTDVVSERGDTISAENLKTRFVRYVLSDSYGSGCGLREKNISDVFLKPDILEELPGMSIKANTVRPLWLSIDVPRDAVPGKYKASLKLYSSKNSPQELRFTIEVLENTLPDPSDWSFHLNMKQEPLIIARWHGVKPWSSTHFELMKPYYDMLAKAGQKGVSCDLFKSKNVDGNGKSTSLVRCRKLSNGKWYFDYENFEAWVDFMHQLGINDYLSIFSIVPDNEHIRYFSEVTNKFEILDLDTHSPQSELFYHMFLTHFKSYLKSKQWFYKTNLVIEDSYNEHLNFIVDVNNKSGADFSLNLAAYKYHPETLDYVDHIAMAPQYVLVDDLIQNRRDLAKKTSLVITCENEQPNFFTFSEPAEASWLPWFVYLNGLDGLYYAGYNSWGDDPHIDSRTTIKPSGADFLVYPNAKSSIRFERLIEGIQDYEKVRLLQNNLSVEQNEALNMALSHFSLSDLKTEPANVAVDQVRSVLYNLSK